MMAVGVSPVYDLCSDKTSESETDRLTPAWEPFSKACVSRRRRLDRCLLKCNCYVVVRGLEDGLRLWKVVREQIGECIRSVAGRPADFADR